MLRRGKPLVFVGSFVHVFQAELPRDARGAGIPVLYHGCDIPAIALYRAYRCFGDKRACPAWLIIKVDRPRIIETRNLVYSNIHSGRAGIVLVCRKGGTGDRLSPSKCLREPIHSEISAGNTQIAGISDLYVRVVYIIVFRVFGSNKGIDQCGGGIRHRRVDAHGIYPALILQPFPAGRQGIAVFGFAHLFHRYCDVIALPLLRRRVDHIGRRDRRNNLIRLPVQKPYVSILQQHGIEIGEVESKGKIPFFRQRRQDDVLFYPVCRGLQDDILLVVEDLFKGDRLVFHARLGLRRRHLLCRIFHRFQLDSRVLLHDLFRRLFRQGVGCCRPFYHIRRSRRRQEGDVVPILGNGCQLVRRVCRKCDFHRRRDGFKYRLSLPHLLFQGRVDLLPIARIILIFDGRKVNLCRVAPIRVVRNFGICLRIFLLRLRLGIHHIPKILQRHLGQRSACLQLPESREAFLHPPGRLFRFQRVLCRFGILRRRRLFFRRRFRRFFRCRRSGRRLRFSVALCRTGAGRCRGRGFLFILIFGDVFLLCPRRIGNMHAAYILRPSIFSSKKRKYKKEHDQKTKSLE